MLNSIKKFIKKNTGYLIRIDDVAENMNWELMNKLEILFNKYNIKPILGVIPNNQDPELLTYPFNKNFWEKIRKWKSIGWEISMHGYSHIYKYESKKKDYFGYGGKSEFFNLSYDEQYKKINAGLLKFEKERIKINSFFAPNHTYDENTLKVLKDLSINKIIDGYGLMPYHKDGFTFIPQLFYKNIILPFGFQSSQIHLNYWSESDYLKFKNFLEYNKNRITTFDETILKVNNHFFYKIINLFSEKTLKFIRFFLKR